MSGQAVLGPWVCLTPALERLILRLSGALPRAGVQLRICESNEWMEELDTGTEITAITCLPGLHLGKTSEWALGVKTRGHWAARQDRRGRRT